MLMKVSDKLDKTNLVNCKVYLCCSKHIIDSKNKNSKRSISIKSIICLVVHDESVVNKIKAVRSCLEWVCNHQLLLFLVKFGKFVNMFTRINTTWNAEAEIEIESFQVLTPEEMSFYHPKVFDRFTSNCKLNSGSNIS